MKSDRVTIAVTGVGAPLGQSIIRAGLASLRRYRLIAMDISDEESAIFPDLSYRKSSHISSPTYQEDLERILRDERVDLLYLGAEREMLGVATLQSEIEARTGSRIALSGKTALEIGTDKLKTAELVRDAGLPYPRSRELSGEWPDILDFAEEIGYPCVVKGRRAGLPFILRNQDDLAYQYRNYTDAVIQEFLGSEEETKEYTVGVFYTPEHGVIDSYCMSRLLRYGLTWRGKYEKNFEVEGVCRQAVEALKPRGSVNVQLRYHKGVPVVHEFNVRCSSSTVFRALSGWNEIDMAVDYFVLRKRPETPKSIKPGFAIRYFQETWIEAEG